MNAFYAKHNIFGLPAGNTGAQMGGWFRKEINTPDDLKGLKMRIGGFAGAVISKLGVVPQQIAGGDIYPALEKGTIDACRVGRALRRREARLLQGRQVLLLPGLVGGRRHAARLHQHGEVGRPAQDLPGDRARRGQPGQRVHDGPLRHRQPGGAEAAAWRRARSCGRSPKAVLDACFKAANEVYADITGKNEDFKKVYESIKAFRADQYLWFQLSENTFDTYMMIQQRKKTL